MHRYDVYLTCWILQSNYSKCLGYDMVTFVLVFGPLKYDQMNWAFTCSLA